MYIRINCYDTWKAFVISHNNYQYLALLYCYDNDSIIDIVVTMLFLFTRYNLHERAHIFRGRFYPPTTRLSLGKQPTTLPTNDFNYYIMIIHTYIHLYISKWNRNIAKTILLYWTPTNQLKCNHYWSSPRTS